MRRIGNFNENESSAHDEGAQGSKEKEKVDAFSSTLR